MANWSFNRKRGFRQRVDRSVRSNFEGRIKLNLLNDGVDFTYESKSFKYLIEHKYTPDFILSNGIIIEAKGLFLPEDRTKHLKVKEQHPELDIRFVFQADQWLTKSKKNKYSDWCKKNGFKYHIGDRVPIEWINERKTNARTSKKKK
ncbi:endonuclease I [uncultured Veillonella sp.]|uniref:endonuclease I n=1 Tax=uncultured Veillonella sp. TaxID=159268 RepID=UPI0025CC4733|nr:endonuclease I [uncultured Veillonella sp.]